MYVDHAVQSRSSFRRICSLILSIAFCISWSVASPQQLTTAKRLQGFDSYIKQLQADWNTPGIGIGIVVNDKLTLAKGYGLRDYGRKLPFTANTLFPIASNTKLFTAIALGMLVEDGKLTWDTPIRESVPSIQFYNDELNDNITLRDMLSHRTGVSRHDQIWLNTYISGPDLFGKLKYLEPEAPIRQAFLYNNIMVADAGYVVALKSGESWQQFVEKRILEPLDMKMTTFRLAEMIKSEDHVVPYQEERDCRELHEINYYVDTPGIAPAAGIISNINDLSHWLIALMNAGVYRDKQVLPANVLTATMQPAIALPNSDGESHGYWELLNTAYGMGRETAVYRGHLITFHSGDLRGFHSEISFLPNDHIGVIVLVIGDNSAPLSSIISYNIYERLLGMVQTPWSSRLLGPRLAKKRAATVARAKIGTAHVQNTKPSHPFRDYVGKFENRAYGTLEIVSQGNGLQLNFHDFQLPLSHYRYDRFDTPDDERLPYGTIAVSFRANLQGDIDSAVVTLDHAQVLFTRQPETLEPKLLEQLSGAYETPENTTIQIVYEPNKGLYMISSGSSPVPLVRVKGLQFKTPGSFDTIYEFTVNNGRIEALKKTDLSTQYVYPRRQN